MGRRIVRPMAECHQTPPDAALGDSAAAGGGEGRSNIRSGRRPEYLGRRPKVNVKVNVIVKAERDGNAAAGGGEGAI